MFNRGERVCTLVLHFKLFSTYDYFMSIKVIFSLLIVLLRFIGESVFVCVYV